MSVDTFWAVPDKAGAIGETGRILKPDARFAFTNWDRDLSPPGYPPPLGNHRSLLEQAAFEVEVYEIQPGAEAKRRAFYERVVAAELTLIEEIGDEGAKKLLFEAKSTLGLTDGTDYLAHSRRIFVVARKRAFVGTGGPTCAPQPGTENHASPSKICPSPPPGRARCSSASTRPASAGATSTRRRACSR